jgi:HD-GYP domain-containing protein (c-di-GMP phosphodiesterase class II)
MYTSGHALSIADLARRVGRVLGLDAAALRDVEHAAVLHDIGKIGIPSELLRKRGPLSTGEREHMRAHPEIGARILEPVERLRQLAPLVRFSHECWDGSGYPDGLAGEQIPLGARIIAVCDAFDAMVSDRPYRGGRSTAEALAELRTNAGTQFDPAVVEAFEQAVGDHRAPAPARVAGA